MRGWAAAASFWRGFRTRLSEARSIIVSILRSASKLSIPIGEVHALVFLTIYLFFIPLFGFIYWYFLEDSFHTPLIQHEPEVINEQRVVRNTIRDSILQYSVQNAFVIVKDVTLNISSLKIINLEIKDNTKFEADVRVDNPRLTGTRGLRVTFDPSNFLVAPQLDPSTRERFMVYSVDPNPFYYDVDRELFEHLFPVVIGDKTQSYRGFMMTESDSFRLSRYWFVVRGKPRFAPGHLVRMIYYSASVITTLGAGEITPITTAARITVTVEAFTGMLLIGLFLNALAHRASRGAD